MVYHYGPLVKWPKTPASHAGNTSSNLVRVTINDLRSTIKKSVFIALRVHPFPFRTRQLSSAVPKILGGQPPGKIGRCRHKEADKRKLVGLSFTKTEYASIAQSVEHLTVNQGVTGSSPV